MLLPFYRHNETNSTNIKDNIVLNELINNSPGAPEHLLNEFMSKRVLIILFIITINNCNYY